MRKGAAQQKVPNSVGPLVKRDSIPALRCVFRGKFEEVLQKWGRTWGNLRCLGSDRRPFGALDLVSLGLNFEKVNTFYASGNVDGLGYKMVKQDTMMPFSESKKGKFQMKHSTLLLVAVLVLNSLAAPQTAQAQEASRSARVKAEVQRRGIGEKSRVKVRLRNKEEVKGYISKIEDASFDVTDKNTGRPTTILYVDVDKVQGSGLSKGAKIGIVVGVAVVVVVVVFAVAFSRFGY